MITQKILEDYLNCSEAMSNGRYDKYDQAVCEGYDEFYNYIQRPRDKQICKMRFVKKYSNEIIANKLGLRSESTVRSRIGYLIGAFNRGETLPACSTKDILYGYYYANRASKEGQSDFDDVVVINEADEFFRSLDNDRHLRMCELRFVSRRSYKYIAMKLGYCDEGTIRRKINRLIAEYDLEYKK